MIWARPQRDKRVGIVRAVLKKFPETGHRTLARKLNAEHPLLFPSLENARNAVRTATGNHGKNLRKQTPDKSQFRKPGKAGQLPPLPKSEAKGWEPFTIDAKRNLILSDLHIPFTSDKAIDAALDYGDEYNPDSILINGDLADFYQLSRFDKNPTVPKIKHELHCIRQLLAHLHARYPNAKKRWKLGNHCERLEKYLMLNAPELFDIPEIRFAWRTAVGVDEYGVEIIDDQRPVMLGKLPVFHGHELGRSIFSPVNPARGAFLRTHHTILVGHSHQTSGHADTNVWHQETFCWSTGCLCDLTPEYARVNRWNHGFATVDVKADGEFDVTNLRISASGRVRKS
jgi:predicted phosphodiesterase